MNDQERIYVCPACGFGYREKKWAEQCEEWCRTHQSCNLEIISHGVPPEGNKPEQHGK